MTQGVYGSGIRGAKCRHCGNNEQHCARRDGCCRSCTHWTAYDQDGNDRRTPPHGHALPLGHVCGTEVGWNKHRHDATTPCPPCRHAHRQTRAQQLIGRTA